jgi:hypothetical protein
MSMTDCNTAEPYFGQKGFFFSPSLSTISAPCRDRENFFEKSLSLRKLKALDLDARARGKLEFFSQRTKQVLEPSEISPFTSSTRHKHVSSALAGK